MIFDLNYLKETFRELIGSYVYPEQTVISSSVSLYDSGSIVQPFYPFATSIDSGAIYVANIVGSPGFATIEISTPDKTISVNSLSLDIGWNVFNIKKAVTSRKEHFIKIYGGVNSSNDYYLGVGPSDSYFYGTMEDDNILAFSIGVHKFVKNIFPISGTFNINSLPLVVVDFISRRSVVDKYLSGDVLIEDVQLGIEIYSRYPDEADRLAYGIERGLVLDREELENIEYLTPIDISPMSFVSPEIFRRDITFNVRLLVTRE